MQNVVGVLDSLGVVELCPVDAGAAKSLPLNIFFLYETDRPLGVRMYGFL